MEIRREPDEEMAEVDLAHEPDFELGGLRISPSTREVHWSGGDEVVQPRVMQVLVCLARAEGLVVSRDDLFRRCWGGRIVGEDAINRCIAAIRNVAALNGDPAFVIETIPRVGYRLRRSTGSESNQPPLAKRPVASIIARLGRRWGLVLAVVIVSTVVGLLFSMPLSRRPDRLPSLLTVAVLPVVNLTGDASLDSAADSLTEDVILVLGRGGYIDVAPRNAVFAFKGKATDERAVGQALHVRNVITSSLRKTDGGFGVNFQIVDAATGQVVVSRTLERPALHGSIPENELSLSMFNAVSLVVVNRWSADQLAKRPDDADPENLLARTEMLLNTPDLRNLMKAEQMIAKTRAMLPRGSGLSAHFEAEVCDYHLSLLRQVTGATPPQRAAWAQMALDAGTEAAVLRPAMTSPHVCRAEVFAELGRWDEGEAEARYVITNFPLTANGYYALATLELARGRFGAALKDFSEVSARDGSPASEIGLTLLFLGQYRQAIAALQQQVVLDPKNPWPHLFLCAALELSGRHDEALSEASAYRKLKTDDALSKTLELSPEPAFVKRAAIIRLALHKAGLDVQGSVPGSRDR